MKTFSISPARPFFPLGMALLAIGQWSEGQVILAEWQTFPNTASATATSVDPAADPSDLVYSGPTVFNADGASEWLLQVDDGSTDHTASFTIAPVGGDPLILQSLSFDWSVDLDTPLPDRQNSFFINSTSSASATEYYDGTLPSSGHIVSGSSTLTFGTPITLTSGQSETFTWTFGHSIPDQDVKAGLSNIQLTGSVIPEPSQALFLTGLMACCVMGHRRRIRG